MSTSINGACVNVALKVGPSSSRSESSTPQSIEDQFLLPKGIKIFKDQIGKETRLFQWKDKTGKESTVYVPRYFFTKFNDSSTFTKKTVNLVCLHQPDLHVLLPKASKHVSQDALSMASVRNWTGNVADLLTNIDLQQSFDKLSSDSKSKICAIAKCLEFCYEEHFDMEAGLKEHFKSLDDCVLLFMVAERLPISQGSELFQTIAEEIYDRVQVFDHTTGVFAEKYRQITITPALQREIFMLMDRDGKTKCTDGFVTDYITLLNSTTNLLKDITDSGAGYKCLVETLTRPHGKQMIDSMDQSQLHFMEKMGSFQFKLFAQHEDGIKFLFNLSGRLSDTAEAKQAREHRCNFLIFKLNEETVESLAQHDIGKFFCTIYLVGRVIQLKRFKHLTIGVIF